MRRPARCSAASTSTISERRESSEPRICLFTAVERAQPGFGVADLGLDAAHLGGNVDELLVELAAVLSDRRDVGLELFLQFRGVLLLRAGGFEFLLALLDGVGRGGGRGLRRLAHNLRGRGQQAHAGKAGGQQRDRQRNPH